MADTKTQREMKEKNPQAPQQNPQRGDEHRAEQGKRQGVQEFGKQPAEKEEPGKEHRQEKQQHQEKQQGQKMPQQQQKKDDQGNCGCG